MCPKLMPEQRARYQEQYERQGGRGGCGGWSGARQGGGGNYPTQANVANLEPPGLSYDQFIKWEE
jgi:hypothetical protein